MSFFRPQRGRPWRSLLAKGVLLAGLALPLTATHAQEDVDRQARLEELRATIQELKEELEQVKSNRSSLLNDLEAAEEKVRETRTKVRELRREMREHESELSALNEEKEALSRVKKQQQGSVGQHVNAAYRLGQQSHLKLLLNQQDPARLSRNLKYYQYLIDARADHIYALNQTIDRLSALEPEIEKTLRDIAQNHEALASVQTRLEQQQDARKRTLSQLEASISDKGERLEALESDRKDLERLLQRVVAVASDFGLDLPERPFGELKGQLPWPCQGEVVRKFGSNRVENKLHWQGLLIRANEGSPVTAVHHGQVVFADYLRGHGLLIIIDHGSGYMSLYAHNEALFKEIGEWVNSGEQIATVGQSGGQATAALYFELRYNGEPTNPASWLTRA